MVMINICIVHLSCCYLNLNFIQNELEFNVVLSQNTINMKLKHACTCRLALISSPLLKYTCTAEVAASVNMLILEVLHQCGYKDVCIYYLRPATESRSDSLEVQLPLVEPADTLLETCVSVLLSI